jgi:hypothetical protein
MATVGPVNVGMPPDPERFQQWREYATALSAFFSGQAQVGMGVQPQAVQLIHVDTTAAVVKDRPRALEDGILAFDPTLGVPVISVGGVWRRFTLVP